MYAMYALMEYQFNWFHEINVVIPYVILFEFDINWKLNEIRLIKFQNNFLLLALWVWWDQPITSHAQSQSFRVVIQVLEYLPIIDYSTIV